MSAAGTAVQLADPAALAELAGCDFSFDVTHELAEPFDDACVARPVPVAAAWRKRYDVDFDEMRGLLDETDTSVFVASVAGRAAGYLVVARCWSGYAIVEDIAVDARQRGTGAGRLLMDAAAAWARDRGLPGMRLETQSNNVAACRFYLRYGFTLGGFDRHLYQALHPDTREVALYWYLPFAAPAP